MIYKILVKNATGLMQFATVRKEITEKEIQTIDGVDTIVEVGTGKYKTVTFETEDIEELKARYIELLDTYKKDDLNAIADIKEVVNITVDVDPDPSI